MSIRSGSPDNVTLRFKSKMAVINECSQRGVKLNHEYIDSAVSEEMRQDIMISLKLPVKNCFSDYAPLFISDFYNNTIIAENSEFSPRR